MKRTVVCIALLCCLTVPVRGGQKDHIGPKAKPIEGANNALNVPYLPDRQVGSVRDEWVEMNIHWPKGDQRRPCILLVHGGGYQAGDKDDRQKRSLIRRALDEGYVVANMNYILGDGIKPQVYHDFKSAVRFLRANAGKYSIDPSRIAAWGFSAGGWLASAGGFTQADDVMNFPLTDLDTDWGDRRKARRGRCVKVRYDSTHAPYADQSARLSAIVADFWSKRQLRYYGPEGPAVLTYVGVGGNHGVVELARKVGNDGNQIVLTGERYRGKNSLHIPPLDAACQPLAGNGNSNGKSTLQVEAFAWLSRMLKESPRALAPEARPIRCRFPRLIDVRLIAPGDAIIRYTTDGSNPDESSPTYDKPIRLTKTTTIKARNFPEGLPPSAIASFTFIKGKPAPIITGPKKIPAATVGKPYRAQFTADGTVGWWNLSGHGEARVKMHSDFVKAPLGIALDPKTGVLAGTPTKGGTFTLQIQAAAGIGQLADTRTYVFVIKESTE